MPVIPSALEMNDAIEDGRWWAAGWHAGWVVADFATFSGAGKVKALAAGASTVAKIAIQETKAALSELKAAGSEIKAAETEINVGRRIPTAELKAPPPNRGNAPIGSDGHPVELHHRGQTPKSPLDEMTRTEHRGVGNFKKNHHNTGQEPSKIDRGAFKQEQKEHWEKGVGQRPIR